MRILRVLASRRLPCGCVVGIYECYDGAVIGVIDVHGPACRVEGHRAGRNVEAA